MDSFISHIFNQDIISSIKYLHQNSNILLISTDIFILQNALSIFKAHFQSLNYNIEDIKTKKDIKDKSLIIIKLDTNNPLLYYYLDLSNIKKCKVIFYTQNILAIDNMEKRVRSRFSNQICLLRSLSLSEYLSYYKYLIYKTNITRKTTGRPKRSAAVQTNTKLRSKKKIKDSKHILNSILEDDKHTLNLILEDDKHTIINSILQDQMPISNDEFVRKMLSQEYLDLLSREYESNRDINNLVNIFYRLKHDISPFTLNSMLNILNIPHLAILLMSCTRKVLFNDVVREFRKFIITCKELKKLRDDEIFEAYCELVEYNLINEKGNILINETCVRRFINMTGKPNYLKNLLNKKII
ncbi:origin recognition complex subunit 4 (ORC4) [Vairimorpha necatrix]|uniref:Origin recognition complex subunit 4 (ORC4) n=1 Tax=Vairimorpha necatrix TaxID=6039 RepID=A0AAX4JFX0_9MICR